MVVWVGHKCSFYFEPLKLVFLTFISILIFMLFNKGYVVFFCSSAKQVFGENVVFARVHAPYTEIKISMSRDIFSRFRNRWKQVSCRALSFRKFRPKNKATGTWSSGSAWLVTFFVIMYKMKWISGIDKKCAKPHGDSFWTPSFARGYKYYAALQLFWFSAFLALSVHCG